MTMTLYIENSKKLALCGLTVNSSVAVSQPGVSHETQHYIRDACIRTRQILPVVMCETRPQRHAVAILIC